MPFSNGPYGQRVYGEQTDITVFTVVQPRTSCFFGTTGGTTYVFGPHLFVGSFARSFVRSFVRFVNESPKKRRRSLMQILFSDEVDILVFRDIRHTFESSPLSLFLNLPVIVFIDQPAFGLTHKNARFTSSCWLLGDLVFRRGLCRPRTRTTIARRQQHGNSNNNKNNDDQHDDAIAHGSQHQNNTPHQ